MTEKCPAALNVVGEHFPCQVDRGDGDVPHPGLAHANSDAEAIWHEDPQALTDAWASAEADGR